MFNLFNKYNCLICYIFDNIKDIFCLEIYFKHFDN